MGIQWVDTVATDATPLSRVDVRRATMRLQSEIYNMCCKTIMSKKVALFTAVLMMLVTLSGCLGLGRESGGELEMTERPSEDVKLEDYNVLYIGHSFGRRFAELLEDYSHTAGITNHTAYAQFSGGASGAPDALWADEADSDRIKEFLDTGGIDVLIMICCSVEFVETGLQSDEAIWNFTEYALDKNSDTRIGLSMPWKDYPGEYENASEHRNGTDQLYDSWVNLASNLSSDFPTADVFTFHHGAAAYELREMFEAGELEEDIEQLTGSKPTSIFTDKKGHAGQITIDTGTLLWLHAVHGVKPMAIPEFTQWETDIRLVAKSLLDEQNQQ